MKIIKQLAKEQKHPESKRRLFKN